MRKHLAFMLAACMITSLTGCAGQAPKEEPKSEPSQTVVAEQPSIEVKQEKEDASMFKGSEYDKAFKMLSLLDNEENVMISPLSINTAIDMASYGLLDEYAAELDKYYGKSLVERTEAYKNMEVNADVLKIANSLWVRDRLMGDVSDTFVNNLTSNYDADVAEFNSESAPVINDWVKEKTNGMIDSIIGEIPDELSTIVMDALYFNGEWIEPFDTDYDVVDETFESTKGKQDCKMMYGEVGSYMENKQATAFKKPYKNGYYFVGILPKKDKLDIENFDFNDLLESETYEYDVKISIPKFESEYSTSLTDVLCQMGIGFIFEPGAVNNVLKPDAAEDLVISDIIHKTAIKMTESGTEAAAVTAVMMDTCAIVLEEPKVKEVYLNRPFLYAITDSEDNILFIGTVNTVE